MTKYILLENTTHLSSDNLKKDDVVYSCNFHDYGLCRDDEENFGYGFTFVTRNEDGSYPGMTVPTHLLSRVN